MGFRESGHVPEEVVESEGAKTTPKPETSVDEAVETQPPASGEATKQDAPLPAFDMPETVDPNTPGRKVPVDARRPLPPVKLAGYMYNSDFKNKGVDFPVETGTPEEQAEKWRDKPPQVLAEITAETIKADAIKDAEETAKRLALGNEERARMGETDLVSPTKSDAPADTLRRPELTEITPDSIKDKEAHLKKMEATRLAATKALKNIPGLSQPANDERGETPQSKRSTT